MLTGDFAALQKLASGLASTQVAIRTAFNAASQTIQATARAGYSNGVGPSGEAWEPKADGTLAMQGPATDVTFKMSGDSLVGEAPDVFQYHLDKRPVFPPDGAFPDAWTAIVDDAVNAELTKAVKP